MLYSSNRELKFRRLFREEVLVPARRSLCETNDPLLRLEKPFKMQDVAQYGDAPCFQNRYSAFLSSNAAILSAGGRQYAVGGRPVFPVRDSKEEIVCDSSWLRHRGSNVSLSIASDGSPRSFHLADNLALF